MKVIEIPSDKLGVLEQHFQAFATPGLYKRQHERVAAHNTIVRVLKDLKLVERNVQVAAVAYGSTKLGKLSAFLICEVDQSHAGEVVT